MDRPVLILTACLVTVIFCTALVVRRPQEADMLVGRWPAAVTLPHAAPDSRETRFEALVLRGSPQPHGAGAAAGERRLRGLIRLAEKFYRKGNVEGALELLRAASKQYPESIGIFAAMGIICAENGRYEEAETFLTRYLDAARDKDLSLLLLLGIVYLQERKYAAAATMLTRVLDIRPDWARARCAAAAALARLGRNEAAIYHLRIAARSLNTNILPLLAQPEFDSLRDLPEFRNLIEETISRGYGPAASASAGTGRKREETQ